MLLCDIHSQYYSLTIHAELYKANYHEDGGKESIPRVLKVNSSSFH